MNRLLNRQPFQIPLPYLGREKVLITGSSGFIGQLITEVLRDAGAEVIQCDLETDVLIFNSIFDALKANRPTSIIHLAAHKYATTAEDNPSEVADLNIRGTANVVEAAKHLNVKVVLASTCKAADPCTVYGASKLIAEREVLNYERSAVVRLVNVLGSTGSVVDIWDKLGKDEPLPVIDAYRHWMTPMEAVKLLLFAQRLPRGIYALSLGKPELVLVLARRYDASRTQKLIPLRRGDRVTERLVGEYETSRLIRDGVIQIMGPWDETT